MANLRLLINPVFSGEKFNTLIKNSSNTMGSLVKLFLKILRKEVKAGGIEGVVF